MRWRGERRARTSRNQDEAAAFPPRRRRGFPSGGSGRGGVGILGILIILGLMFFFGVDPSVILQGGPPSGGSDPNFPDIELPQSRPNTTNFPVPGRQGTQIEHPQTSSEDDLKQFVSVVLAETEDV